MQLADLGYDFQRSYYIHVLHRERGLYAVINAHTTMSAAFAKHDLPHLRHRLMTIVVTEDGATTLIDIDKHWKYLKNVGYADKQLKDVFKREGASGLASIYRILKDLENQGYTGEQRKYVFVRRGTQGLAILGSAHHEMAPAFAESELPALRQELVEMICGDGGPQLLSKIARDWNDLRGFGYLAEQLASVLNRHGPPGLTSFRLANGYMLHDILTGDADCTRRTREQLLEVADKDDGIGTLHAICRYYEILQRKLDAEKILNLACQPDGATLLKKKADSIRDSRRRRPR